MEIRKSNETDVQAIMKLVHQAQNYFKNAHIDQWQDGYPNEETILSDIKRKKSYVLVDKEIIGTMYFAIEDDPCYGVIDGSWLTAQQPYAVIHRIVVDESVKGNNIALHLLEFAKQECIKFNIASIRIDTHADNLSMQRFLLKHQFKKCGQITLESGAPRIGFEKSLNK